MKKLLLILALLGLGFSFNLTYTRNGQCDDRDQCVFDYHCGNSINRCCSGDGWCQNQCDDNACAC